MLSVMRFITTNDVTIETSKVSFLYFYWSRGENNTHTERHFFGLLFLTSIRIVCVCVEKTFFSCLLFQSAYDLLASKFCV